MPACSGYGRLLTASVMLAARSQEKPGNRASDAPSASPDTGSSCEATRPDNMDEITTWLLGAAGSPWIYLALFLLVVFDAFLVVLPSETLVVALGALAAASGEPSILLVVPIAAIGALIGDSLCYLIGRSVGIDRWAWQRRRRIAAALARARGTVLTRAAVLIFTARYIPYARIAVNLSAGAAGLPLRRFLPLAAVAGTTWAVYNVVIGAAFGSALPGSPLLAILLSVAVAIALGVAVDLVTRRIEARRSRPQEDAPATGEGVLPGPDPKRG